jgi:serine/threonine protein kinase
MSEHQPSAGYTTNVENEGLAEIAVPRLRYLAIVLAIIAGLMAAAVVLVMTGTIAPRMPKSTEMADVSLQTRATLILTMVAIAIVTSCGMIAITKVRAWSPQRVLNVGIVFQILGALCITVVEEQTSGRQGLSLVNVWILSFALVPQRTGRAAVAAFGAAFAGPAAIALNVAFGFRGWPSAVSLLGGSFGAFMSALLVMFINKVVYSLGREVADAKRLGAYTLVEKLGQGGMGEVWRAEHRALIRPAAVKLLRRETSAGMTREDLEATNLRFQREVQATALLTSPHTIAVYDFGSTSDHTLYYVMELLHGLDAERLVDAHGPLPAERVVYLLRQACESLSDAHASNLIHRDIKPANLYLCAIGRKVDFIKVLDFGLVRDLASDVRLTGAGFVPGTPAYVAPETAAKNVVDARSDIYALGCVAYWMLTGRLVFEAQTAAGMMAAHIRDQAPPPSRRTELAVPPELDDLVLACLAKEPSDRPQTAQELRERLDAIPFAERWNQDRARAWWNTHAPDVLLQPQRVLAPIGGPDDLRRRPEPVRHRT